MEFYSYLWLREDGTPRYVGKGSGKRAYIRHGKFYPPIDKSRIVVFPAAAESEAFATEIELIRNWGRKDLGTGCLHNHTDGGENPPNWKGRKRGPQSDEHLRRLKISRKGRCGGWNIGISPGAEVRQKIAHTLQGNKNALGHSVSEEVRYQWGQARKGRPTSKKGKKMSEAARQNLKGFSKGNIPWNKNRITSDEVKQKQRVSALARGAREREDKTP